MPVSPLPAGAHPAAVGLAVALLLGAACRAPAAGPARPAACAWRLVEADAPGGRELVLERHDGLAGRVEIRLFRERAPVGEVVEAEIRLPRAEGPVTFEARPDRPGVRVLGPSTVTVEKGGAARVRFTCESPGRGGIELLVKEAEP